MISLDIYKLHTINIHNDNTDIHIKNPFTLSFREGKVEMVNLLLSLEGDRYINVNLNDEYAFKTACMR